MDDNNTRRKRPMKGSLSFFLSFSSSFSFFFATFNPAAANKQVRGQQRGEDKTTNDKQAIITFVIIHAFARTLRNILANERDKMRLAKILIARLFLLLRLLLRHTDTRG